jgi:hypothetical protein
MQNSGSMPAAAGEMPVGRFLLHHSSDFEQVCCWNGCHGQGKPYQVKRIHLNTSRFYCDRHAFSAELAGFAVVPLFSSENSD